jgi:hypothetical protein
MPRPPGRPKADEPTEILPVRVRVTERERLDRHLDWLESRMGLRASRSGVMARALTAYLDTQTHLGIQKSTEKSVSREAHDARSPGDNVNSDEEPERPQAARAPLARASVVEPPREAAVPVPKPPYGAGIAGVLDALAHLNRATPAEVAKELGALTKHVWRDLQRLVKQGKVRREGEYYRPA